MSGRIWLDWAILAVSLFNTILAFWLALTVLFNADRRDAGVWLMGGGLLVGAAFFISHSAILGQELSMNLVTLNLWWRLGWFPVMVAPFAWYVAVLWYGGFWSEDGGGPARRHRLWLWLVSLSFVGLLGLMIFANPIPAFDQLADTSMGQALTVRNLPPLLLLFPLWMVVCILLSIDVLHRPAQTKDLNAAWARQRARPWLLGTAATLLAICLAVIYLLVHVLVMTSARSLPVMTMHSVAIYDLALSLLIALALLLLGQAVVVHEVFTGRVLPRRSLARHWRNAILLATGYATVVAGSLTLQLRPIYSLLLATLLITLFYALYGWRTLRQREQLMARLRPFVQSQGSTANAQSADKTAGRLLAALCNEVLDTAHGQLIPLGSMGTLVGPALFYPATDARQQSTLPDLHSPRTSMTPLDPARYGPYRWAISLWGEGGVTGALLVGAKRDGGLYSQEEMELAQATGERILQFLASEQMLQRLMELQRTRTAAQRVMDLRTRRTLHDEILPTLHLAVLQLAGVTQGPAIDEARLALAETHRQIAELLTATQPAPACAPDPCNLINTLRNLVDTEFAHHFAEIHWHGAVTSTPTTPDSIHVDALTGEVVVGAAREVIRNAALHGRGGKTDRPLRLDITLAVEANELVLVIQDNGVGMTASRAAAPSGGSGSGLALHSTLLAMVGGYLTVDTLKAGGTSVKITAAREAPR